jgi:hypothetical protein
VPVEQAAHPEVVQPGPGRGREDERSGSNVKHCGLNLSTRPRSSHSRGRRVSLRPPRSLPSAKTRAHRGASSSRNNTLPAHTQSSSRHARPPFALCNTSVASKRTLSGSLSPLKPTASAAVGLAEHVVEPMRWRPSAAGGHPGRNGGHERRRRAHQRGPQKRAHRRVSGPPAWPVMPCPA